MADALHIMETLFKPSAIAPMINACAQGQSFATTLEVSHFETRIIYLIRCNESVQ